MKDEDSDTTFCYCVFFSFLVGCGLAVVLTCGFFPASTGIASDLVACLCYAVLSATFISLLLYASNIIFPRSGGGKSPPTVRARYVRNQ